MVGFTGSRKLSAAYAALVNQVVKEHSRQKIAVGCARGLDAMVRMAANKPTVFRAKDFGGSWPAKLAQRSIKMVHAVAASKNPLVIGFVAKPCPAALFPSQNASKCFGGFGSGTWATLALSVGLGVPIRVYVCCSQFGGLPGWGVWVNKGKYYTLETNQQAQIRLF